MGRRKKPGFKQMKMFASRIEEADYKKFEAKVSPTGKTLQEVVNMFVRSFISGTVYVSGSVITGEDNE